MTEHRSGSTIALHLLLLIFLPLLLIIHGRRRNLASDRNFTEPDETPAEYRTPEP